MARVTVEDCLDHVENRFALVHATAKRAKQLYKGVQPKVTCDNREIVVALREIADASLEVKEPGREEEPGTETKKPKSAKKKK